MKWSKLSRMEKEWTDRRLTRQQQFAIGWVLLAMGALIVLLYILYDKGLL